MDKYIKAEPLLKKAKEISQEHSSSCLASVHIIRAIEEAPEEDVVEVKHGEWKEVNQIGKNSRHIRYTTKQCSVCGYWNGRKKTNYCPNCGAKMDLKEGEEG